MALIKTTRAGRPLYRVRWNYQRDPETGKRSHQERSFRKHAEARAFDKRVNAGTSSRAEKTSVAQILTAWQDEKAGSWQRRTRNDYEQQCRIRIVPYLGSKRLAAVTPEVAHEWKNWMRTQGHSPTVVNKAIQTLKAANKWARGTGMSQNLMLDDVPLVDTDPPKPARPLTPSQITTITKACKLHRDAALITLGAYSGLRMGELRGLQWQDVHLDTRTLVVARSVDMDLSTKLPKSGKPRTVAVLQPGIDALRDWKAACTGTDPTDWVFPAHNGKPLWSRWYAHNLAEIREKSGIHFDPHELRDTYASILIAAGVGEAELTMWLGHSSVEITVRRYAQVYAGRRASVSEKANSIIATLG